jgi:hypothetical protein
MVFMSRSPQQGFFQPAVSALMVVAAVVLLFYLSHIRIRVSESFGVSGGLRTLILEQFIAVGPTDMTCFDTPSCARAFCPKGQQNCDNIQRSYFDPHNPIPGFAIEAIKSDKQGVITIAYDAIAVPFGHLLQWVPYSSKTGQILDLSDPKNEGDVPIYRCQAPKKNGVRFLFLPAICD